MRSSGSFARTGVNLARKSAFSTTAITAPQCPVRYSTCSVDDEL